MKKVLLAICFAFAFLFAGCSNYWEPSPTITRTIKNNISQQRFLQIYVDGRLYIMVDTVTRVQYLQIDDGYRGYMSPLIDQDGKPILYEGPLE